MQKVTNTKKIKKIKNSNNMDMPLLISVLMLLALGIVMVLSASAPSALADYGDSYKFVKTQLRAAILGVGAMLFLSRFTYQIFKRYYKIIYVLSILVLFTVLIPGLGVESNGARRWIHFLGLQLQPSEITKIGLIIFYAGYFSDPTNNLNKIVGNIIIPIGALLVPIAILLLIQNHMSAGLVMSFVTIVMILMSGCKLKYYGELLIRRRDFSLSYVSFYKR